MSIGTYHWGLNREQAAMCWIVLDNIKNHWSYWTNLNKEIADKAYLNCVRNEWIKDGKITEAGIIQLMMPLPTKEQNQ